MTLSRDSSEYSSASEDVEITGCGPSSSTTSTVRSALPEESRLLAQSIRDRQFALSLSTAIALDQHLIAEALRDEAIAESDHAMALALSQGNDYNPPENDHPKIEAEDASVNAMCEIITDLAQKSAARNEQEDVVIAQSLRFGQEEENCIACVESVGQLPIFESACGHIYCSGCTRSLILGATTDEQLYPPRCCNYNIPPSVPLHLLDFKELSNFTAKGVEFSCSDRFYCARSDCSTFLLPSTIENEQARCPECETVTHTVCRTSYKPGHECPSDEALQQLLKLAGEQKWMRCPQCKTMIELRSGCHHMTCKCGKHFCYVCGGDYGNCQCVLWQEDRLVEIADRVVDNEVPAVADARVRARVRDRVIRNLRNHENDGCQHEDAGQWEFRRMSDVRCEVCSQDMPMFIFECTSCHIFACKRCKLNRMG